MKFSQIGKVSNAIRKRMKTVRMKNKNRIFSHTQVDNQYMSQVIQIGSYIQFLHTHNVH